MLKDFKAFLAQGSVLDLAVGMIIGAGFGKIVASLVNDIILPPISLLFGSVDYKNLFIDLSGKGVKTLEQAKELGAPTLNYGLFVSSVLEFVILAFCIFLIVRMATRLKKPPEVSPVTAPSTKDCPHCFTAIPISATRCPACTSQL